MELRIDLHFDGISVFINSILPQIPMVNSEHKDQSKYKENKMTLNSQMQMKGRLWGEIQACWSNLAKGDCLD